MSLTFGSACSGIEAASCAWTPLGWRAAWYAERDPLAAPGWGFAAAVLARRWPETVNLGDITEAHEHLARFAAIDVLVGGTPCQSFSVAGLRKGLDDPRGVLALAFLRLAATAWPRWVVWENVPGVLSHDRGRTFGSILGALAKLGYGWAYRVLDAQYFGLAQRRKRVFVVGCLGDWRGAAAVLFERGCLRGDSPPRREARQAVAGTLGGSSQSGGVRTTDLDNSGAYVVQEAAQRENPASGPQGAGWARELAFTLEARQRPQAVAFGAGRSRGPRETAGALDAKGGSGHGDFEHETFIVDPTQITSPGNYSHPKAGDPSHPLTAEAHVPLLFSVKDRGDGHPVALTRGTIRRLTPHECERLQGFPDDYTLIPWEKARPFDAEDFAETVAYLRAAGFDEREARELALTPDGPRYKAIGNSMAVPVMRWLGERIAAVHAILEAAA